jgi:hypothetical protein
MKGIATCLLLLITAICSAQKLKVDPKMLELGWSFLSPIVLEKINDPLTKEIVEKSIPKIIRDDIKGAIVEVSDATLKIKNVKVVNKQYISIRENKVNKAFKAVKNKDYASAVNELSSLVAITNQYIKNGLIDKDVSQPSGIDNNVKADVVKSDEINGKVYIEKNSNYYFFVPNGSVSEISSPDTTLVKFNLKLTDGKSFEIGIARYDIEDENLSIETLEKNPAFRDDWTGVISKTVLKERFGDGIPSAAVLYNASNFRAYKLPYLATTNAAMTTSLLAFHNASLYLIYFKSSQNDFSSNNRQFEDLINMFYFGERMSLCEIKKTSKITVQNKSLNPYEVSLNGNIVGTVEGKKALDITVGIGTALVKAVQKTGYMVYPTINERKVNVSVYCQNEKIDIGFED